MTLSNEFTRKSVPEIRSYEQANEYLGKKNSRPLRYKTRVNRRGENIAITHHETDIITYQPSGSVIIDTQGWHTSTTKERLNCHLPNGFDVYQMDNIWYLSRSIYMDSGDGAKRVVFADGMTIMPDGTIEGAGPPIEELKKLNKDILKYSRSYIEALFAGKVPKPKAHDCWYCVLRFQTGETMGETTQEKNHLLSHFDEKYYVPSLLVRAIEVFPVSLVAKSALGYLWGYIAEPFDFGYEIAKQQLRSSLRRYLRRQLGLAS